MSFEFTVLPDERFVEILEAWVDSPWPKTAEDGYALRDRFGWTQKEGKPNVFTSDVHPIGFPCYFTAWACRTGSSECRKSAGKSPKHPPANPPEPPQAQYQ